MKFRVCLVGDKPHVLVPAFACAELYGAIKPFHAGINSEEGMRIINRIQDQTIRSEVLNQAKYLQDIIGGLRSALVSIVGDEQFDKASIACTHALEQFATEIKIDALGRDVKSPEIDDDFLNGIKT